MIVCEANGEIRVSFNFYQHQSRSEFANNKMRIRKIDQNAFWLKSTLCYFYSFHLFIFRWKRLEEESKKTFFVKSDEITLNEIEVQIRLNQSTDLTWLIVMHMTCTIVLKDFWRSNNQLSN